MRAEECSGPCPSYPCGSSMTSAEGCRHFDSAEVMNWSMMTWAPLAKSPNCASQIVKPSGMSKEWPYSKPSTAASESMLL